MYELDKGKFGRFVAGRRHELGLTQRASRLGVSDKAVSKWETGQSLPDVALVVPLAEALGVSASELLECRRGPGRQSGARGWGCMRSRWPWGRPGLGASPAREGFGCGMGR